MDGVVRGGLAGMLDDRGLDPLEPSDVAPLLAVGAVAAALLLALAWGATWVIGCLRFGWSL